MSILERLEQMERRMAEMTGSQQHKQASGGGSSGGGSGGSGNGGSQAQVCCGAWGPLWVLSVLFFHNAAGPRSSSAIDVTPGFGDKVQVL